MRHSASASFAARARNRSALTIVAAGAVVAIVASVPFVAQAAPPVAQPWERPATNEEIGMMVFANMARAEPSADGGTETPVLPLRWNDNLATAARAHTYDMAENGCYQHNSCNGRSWSRRLTSYYPSWEWIGENIGAGSTSPEFLHNGWMGSTGHRGNILSGAYNEFGGGIAIGEDNFGPFPLATGDFGRRALFAISSYPMIPAGYIGPRQASANTSRAMLVNYFNPNGVDSVVAVVNGQSVPMSLYRGTTTNGTYRLARTFSGSGCQPLHFEARRGPQFYRWPANDEILVGVNRDDCAERGTGGGGGSTTSSSSTSSSSTSSTSTTTTTFRPTTPPPAAPVVTIDAPGSGARISGHVEIRAHATDSGRVKRIEVYVDNKMLVRRNSGVVTRKWLAGAAAVTPGNHTITVKAYDDEGNVGTKSITVTK